MKKAPADGPGIEGKTKHPSISVQPAQGQRPVDIRASLLLRAAARYDLLHHGVIGLDEAFDNQFISDLLEATGACHHVIAAPLNTLTVHTAKTASGA
jgi:hypothetical protein